jgi:hypothetical protein
LRDLAADHCHEQPGCARHALWLASAPQGVTVPMHTDEVDCQLQPRCCPHSFCVESAVHAVSVPLHGVALVDQLQPGVVHADCVICWPHVAMVPVQVPPV